MTPTPCPACGGTRTIVNDATSGAVTWCNLPHTNYYGEPFTGARSMAAPVTVTPAQTQMVTYRPPFSYGSGTAR